MSDEIDNTKTTEDAPPAVEEPSVEEPPEEPTVEEPELPETQEPPEEPPEDTKPAKKKPYDIFDEHAPMFPDKLVPHLLMIVHDPDHDIVTQRIVRNSAVDVPDWDVLLYHVNRLWHPMWFGKKTLYIRDPLLNYYRPDNGDIARCVMMCLRCRDLCVSASHVSHELLDKIVNHTPSNPFDDPKSRGLLNFSNGILDTNTMTMVSDTDAMFDYVISTPYIKYEKTPEMDAFLSVYGDAGKEVIAILAKVLWQRCNLAPLKELTVIYGDKDTGKTSVSELVQATLDGNLNSKRNTSRVLLGALLQRFGYTNLEHKLLNLGDDLPDMFIKNAGRINEFLGSIHHDIEHKGVDSYTGLITAYNLFTTNNLPPLDDDDFVLWSKIRLVRFEKKLERGTPVEPLYTQTIKEQLLYRAIELMLTWNIKAYRNDQTPEQVRELWHAASTEVDLFFNTFLMYEESKATPLADIKAKYEWWCVKTGHHLHIKHLTKKLQPYLRRTTRGNVYAVSIAAEAELGSLQVKLQDTLQLQETTQP